MNDYIKKFDTVSDQNEFINGSNYIEPHVSCTSDGENIIYNMDNTAKYAVLKNLFATNFDCMAEFASGIVWSDANISSANEPYVIYHSNGDYFSWDGNKYGNEDSGYIKYNQFDKKTKLDLSDDPCYNILNEDWRLPTKDELEELLENTRIVYHGGGERKYWMFYINGQSPATFSIPCGKIWSSTLSDNINEAYCLNLPDDETSMPTIIAVPRSTECNIRPVRIKEQPWKEEETLPYKDQYFTIKSHVKSELVFDLSYTDRITSISFSVDNGEWIDVPTTSDTGAPLPERTIVIPVNPGTRVRWSGVATAYCYTNPTSSRSARLYTRNTTIMNPYDYDVNFSSLRRGGFDVYGNIQSLLFGDNFKNERTPSELNALGVGATFAYLFSTYGNNEPNPVFDASNLILPDFTVNNMYRYMFANSYVNKAPKLVSPVAQQYAYGNMFANATQLEEAEIYAIKLSQYSCSTMFGGCSNLNRIRAGFVDIGTTSQSSGSAPLYRWLPTTTVNQQPVLVLNNRTHLSTSTSGAVGKIPVPSNWTIQYDAYTENIPFAICLYDKSNAYLKATSNNIYEYSTTCISWFKLTTSSTSCKGTGQPTVYFIRRASSATGNQDAWLNVTAGNAEMYGRFSDVARLVMGELVNGKRSIIECQVPSSFNISSSYLTNAESLIFPEGPTYQLKNMFHNFASLLAAPKKLPPITSAYEIIRTESNGEPIYDRMGIYEAMFSGCSSLTTAPELPTTLSTRCFAGMFNGCSSLTTAPELPALELADGCYSGMFCNCSGLTAAPELPATKLANDCYMDMFSGCSSLTTAPELPALELTPYCYSHMFQFCTALRSAPLINGRYLVKGCYNSMFAECTQLQTVTALFVDYYDSDGSYTYSSCLSLKDWLKNVSEYGNIYINSRAAIMRVNEEERNMVTWYQISSSWDCIPTFPSTSE